MYQNSSLLPSHLSLNIFLVCQNVNGCDFRNLLSLSAIHRQRQSNFAFFYRSAMVSADALKSYKLQWIESGQKKNRTHVLYEWVNTNLTTLNLMKSANCWHLSHSKIVHNLYISLFLGILGQFLSKSRFLKIPSFFNRKMIFKQKSRLDDKIGSNFFEAWHLIKNT